VLSLVYMMAIRRHFPAKPVGATTQT